MHHVLHKSIFKDTQVVGARSLNGITSVALHTKGFCNRFDDLQVYFDFPDYLPAIASS